jgi:hypothetical protein
MRCRVSDRLNSLLFDQRIKELSCGGDILSQTQLPHLPHCVTTCGHHPEHLIMMMNDRKKRTDQETDLRLCIQTKGFAKIVWEWRISTFKRILKEDKSVCCDCERLTSIENLQSLDFFFQILLL